MRVLIVEDEPLARAVLRDFLKREKDLILVGEATDGRAAVKAIEQLAPDLVFLDVRLPELSGLQVLERVRRRPAIVFTTAFDHYAVTAFELEAVDYLVKPFGEQRFRHTLERVRRRLSKGKPHEVPVALSDGLIRRPLRRLYAHKRDRIVPIAVDRIEHIEGAGDYSEVHCKGESFLVSMRLKELEKSLDPACFVRIHRSHLVNLDYLAEVRSRDSHRLEVVLKSGAAVPASRSGSTRLRQRIKDRPRL